MLETLKEIGMWALTGTVGGMVALAIGKPKLYDYVGMKLAFLFVVLAVVVGAFSAGTYYGATLIAEHVNPDAKEAKALVEAVPYPDWLTFSAIASIVLGFLNLALGMLAGGIIKHQESEAKKQESRAP